MKRIGQLIEFCARVCSPVHPLLGIATITAATLLLILPLTLSVNTAEAAGDRGWIAIFLCDTFSFGCPQEPALAERPTEPRPGSDQVQPLRSGESVQPATTTVIQHITNPVVEHVIERIIQSPPMTSGRVLGASAENGYPQNFATVQQLADLQNQINALANLPRSVFVPSFTGPAASTPVSTAAFALSQKIDQLSGTSLSGITVNGVSGLTDADIPNSLTASGYLPLSGGTLSGDLTMSGTLSAGALSVAAISSGGAIEGPYVNATSTTATSTFAGGITGPNDFTIQQTSGRVGIGTAIPSTVMHVVMNNGDSGMYLDQFADRIPIIMRRANGTPATPSATLTGNILGGTMAGGYTTGFTGARAKITMAAADDWSPSTQATYITFDTTPSNVGGSLLERMRITSTGNVGIGTTTPWGKLSIKGAGTGTGKALVITDSSDVERMVVQDNGNVGIGTTGPGETLEVAGILKISGDNQIYLGGNTYGVLNRNVTSADIYFGEPADSGKYLFRGTGDTTFQGNVGIGATNPLSKFSLAAPSGSNTVEFGIYNDAGAAKIGRLAMDDILKLILDGYSTKGVYLPTALSIGAGSEYAGNAPPTGGAIISGNVGIGTTSPWGRLSIKGTGTGTGKALVITDSSDVERMIVQDNGNVGIGTTSPGAKLEVAGVAQCYPLAGYQGLKIGWLAGRGIDDTGDSDWGMYRNSEERVRYFPASTAISGGNGDRSLYILSTGNVGIGTTTPGSALSVASGLSVGSNYGVGAPTNGAIIQGNVGIGTTSPWKKLSVTGTVGFDGLTAGAGAGSLCLSANNCPPSALMRQIGRVEEGRISGSS